jgi:hypothetical protein
MGFEPYSPLSTVNMVSVIRPEQSCAPLAPLVALHRTVKDAADVNPPAASSSGMSMRGYRFANVEVVPIAGNPSPNIEVLQWSESAGRFVSYSPAKTASAPAANTPYSAQFQVNDAVIWVKVTGIVAPGDLVEILVSGSSLAQGI